MAPLSMTCSSLGAVLTLLICILSCENSQASVVKRCVIPHNVEPGHIVTALSNIGQRYSIVHRSEQSLKKGKDYASYFTVLSNGDLVTNQAINELVGKIFSLTIDNMFPGGKWQDVVHIHVQDASNLLVFPKQKYIGHISENMPIATSVQELDDLYAIAKYGNKKIVYSVSSGDSNIFDLKQRSINGADRLTVVTKSQLDREEKNEYDLVIQATDDDGDVAATDIKIYVDDVDDNIPSFESTLYKATIPDTTAPDTLILFVKASDPDEQQLGYLMKSPNHFFQVIQENGAVVLKTNLLLKPDVYSFDVVAVDAAGHESDPARVAVTVTGNLMYQQPTEFNEKILHRSKRVVRRPFTVNVKENQHGQLFYAGRAADGEKFEFIEPVYEEFSLDYDNGAVWLRPGFKLDYDFSKRQYDIRVNITKPSDPSFSDIQEINLQVTDVNDEPPIFTNMPKEMVAAVDMNAFEGHVVYELHAADRDLNASIRYYIVSESLNCHQGWSCPTITEGSQNYFTVHPQFGTITLIRKGISQNHFKFTLAVMAKDVASYWPQNVTDRLTIYVGKLDPQFYLNFYDVTVPEMSKTDKVVTQIKARSFQRETLTYRLKTESGANSTDFYINETTGNVYAYREFRYEERPRSFNLMVFATENPLSGERRTSRVPLRINVTDINNHIPSFPLSSYIKENVSEDIPIGTEILTVAASDYDGGPNGRLTYTVSDDHFSVRNADNRGYIKVAKQLDYDRIPEHAYNFRVYATDGGKNPLTGSTSVQVIMRNINDERPQFPLNVSYHSVDEDALPGTTVAVVQAIDIDGSSISYSFDKGETSDIFRINPVSGMIVLEKMVDANRDFYTLNVFATDDGSCVPCTSVTKPLSNNASIIVEVMDINNHRPDFPDCRRYAPVVKEELDPGARVTQVKAKDEDSGSNGKIIYSIVYPRHEDKYFLINNTTGEIFTNYKFKREGSKKAYSVTVKAEDRGRPSLEGVCSFQVHILDINDHVPEFDKAKYFHTMMMDTAPSVSILRVYATDRDEGQNAQVRYHKTSDDCGNFAINQISGVISLDRTFPAPCHDILQPTICNLTIEARDLGQEPPPERWQVAKVQIQVNSSEQQPPRWLIDDGTSFQIEELTPQGHTVVTLAAMPPVSGQLVSFDIVSIDGNDFFFTPSGSSDVQPFRTLTHTDKNEVELKVNSPMDYESIKEYRVKLRATVGDKSSELLLNISLQDKNDNAPTFTSYNSLLGNYQGSIGENVPAGKSVIQVTAYDLDTEPAFKTVTYRLQKTADWKDFRINKKTGEIFSNKEFDRETKDEYRITVIAEDGAPSDAGSEGPNVDFKGVIIAIADQNDNAPYFEKPSYNTTISELADITSSVITVTAKDSDSTAKLTYSIVGGNKHNVFGIREGVGEIYVAQSLDYDTDPKVYNLKVRVFDGKYYNDTIVQITLLNENDNPPVFNPAFYMVNNVIEHDVPPPEGKFLVQTHAIDVDAAYTNIYYALSGADANEYFKIDGQGRLFQIKEIDREAPDSSVRLWEFNVLGTDERLTGYAVVTIEVQDINDNAPIFVNSLLKGYLKENAGPNIEVLKVEAKDSDKGENQTVYYEILEQVPRVGRRNQMAFEMRDDTSGRIYTRLSGIDREDNIDQFKLIIRARDGGRPAKSTTATATIIIMDENDNAPHFTKKNYEIEIPENMMNGTTFHTVSATDNDFSSQGHLTFSLDENSRKTFSIQSIYVTDTGVLQVYNMTRLDFEKPQFRRFVLDLKVTDGKFTDTARMIVKVMDVNDNKPIFRANASTTMYENKPVGTKIKTFVATDADQGQNALFDYKIDPETDPYGNLNIDRYGRVTVVKPLDREQWTSDAKRKAMMTARILAVDKGFPPQTGSSSLTITLLDVNDNFPKFAYIYHPVIDENVEPPAFIVSVHAKDPDNATNGPPFVFSEPADSPTREFFTLQFIQGGDNGNGAGDIKTKAKFDREKQKYYYMPIIMTDRQGLSGTNTLTITIGDKNDNMHQPGHKNIDIYNYEGWKAGDVDYSAGKWKFRATFIGNVYAQDYDDWDLPDKTFEFVGDPPPYFRVDRGTGALHLTSYLPEGRYDMEFKVTDNYYHMSVISTVTVISRNIPQEPVYNAGSFRITGVTAEEFVDRDLPDSSKPNFYQPSLYMQFREKIAKILETQLDFVEIFTVMNCKGEKGKCVDVRYSAHGSPYYKPARMNGVFDQHRDTFNEILQEKNPDAVLAMVPVDLCMNEVCESGCSNVLTIGRRPHVINTNGSTLVGIKSFVEAKCQCEARKVSKDVSICTAGSCFNGGVCKQLDEGFSCACPPGFDGPRCQQTKRQFNGDGWAWFPPLKQCLQGHTYLSFMTREDGLLLYNGPMRVPSMSQPTDFIAIEIVNGYVRVTVDHGSGPSSVTVGGRRGSASRAPPVTDGKWHRVDIFRQANKKDITGLGEAESGNFAHIVRVVVDSCKDAPITETGQSIQDRNSCERFMETPGSHKFINVNQPLQLGGRKNLLSPFPGSLVSKGFKGCVKDLVHDGELYDLYIGDIGEQDGSSDGCPDEDVFCGGNSPVGLHCVNGKCVSNLVGQLSDGVAFKCICDPGWKGHLCNTRTKEINFNDNSYINWKLSQVHLMDHFTSDIQIMFRTRQRDGVLMYFKGQYSTREFMMLRVNEYRLEFQYNLGNLADKELSLYYVNASNGEWHTVYVQRFGKAITLKMDIGEGRFYNHTSGDTHDHQITRLDGTVLGGADDYKDSCLKDPRYNNGWFPVDRVIEKSPYAEIVDVKNVTMGCKTSSCIGKYCIQPFMCVDKWRLQVCECPAGYYEGFDNSSHSPVRTCFNVSECLSSPCLHGACFDRVNDYHCECEYGWEGKNCGQRQEKIMASLSTGALVAILVCLFLLMLLVLAFVIYTRRRREDDKYILEVDPDDDVRENIVNYDEEGAGEEDHDGYDLTRLRKPEEPNKPKVEKVKLLTNAAKPAPPPRTTPVTLPATQPKPQTQTQPSQPTKPHPPVDVGEFIKNRLKDANNDPNAPPNDSPHDYNYEGGGSTAGSLSSLNSDNSENDQDYNFLNTYGPRFNKLANMYGGGEDD